MKFKSLSMTCIMIFLLGIGFSTSFTKPIDEDHHGSHHHLNELAVSMGYVQMHPEKEEAFGLHLHFMRRLGEEGLKSYFGIGLGTEILFSDHPHTTYMATLGVFPWENLVFTISPGMLTVKEDGETQRHFSLHLELMVEYEVFGLVMGPAIGFSKAGEDSHITIGLHIGKGF